METTIQKNLTFKMTLTLQSDPLRSSSWCLKPVWSTQKVQPGRHSQDPVSKRQESELDVMVHTLQSQDLGGRGRQISSVCGVWWYTSVIHGLGGDYQKFNVRQEHIQKEGKVGLLARSSHSVFRILA